MDLKIVPITKAHKREEFDCGEESLNTYLKKYAKQSHKVGSVRT
ncbi:MAG TPA: hypothetical protein VFG50_17330 [Rhodothermales bacterium]|nr:hypothetical protein [Rhodothermales bacterium]